MTRPIFFAGLDESNHGNFPEVVTAVLSDTRSDMEPIGTEGFPRIPGRRTGIEGTLGDMVYVFTLITEEHVRAAEKFSQVKAAAVATLLAYLGNLESAILDGGASRDFMNLVAVQMLPNHLPRLEIIPKADTTIPVVHKADRAAFLLYREMISLGVEDFKMLYEDHYVPLEMKVLAHS